MTHASASGIKTGRGGDTIDAPATRMTVMDDPRGESAEIQRLREEATARLQDAVRCADSARRDALLREALASLDRARALRDRVGNGRGDGAGSPGAKAR